MFKKNKKIKKTEKFERVYKCKAKLVELKGDGEKGIVEAYVSVFGNVDSYGDIIEQGAFADSLAKKLPKGVWSHNWDQPIAKTLEAREDNHGLYIKGQLVLGVQKAKEAYELMKAGVIDEFSIGFFIEEYEYDEVNDIRTIKKIRLIEWSPVLAGANPDTNLINIKSKEKKKEEKKETVKVEVEIKDAEEVKTALKEAEETLKIAEKTIADLKAGKVLSEKNRKLVKSVIDDIEELNEISKNILAPLKQLLDATDDSKGTKVDADVQMGNKTILRLKRNAKKVDKINEENLKILKFRIKK